VKYKISMSTYNLDIIEAFSTLGNKKSQFIEQALLNFIGTTKGKDTLRLMAEHKSEVKHNVTKGKRTPFEQKDRIEKESGRMSVDSFLE
jgi:hypothetical protein